VATIVMMQHEYVKPDQNDDMCLVQRSGGREDCVNGL